MVKFRDMPSAEGPQILRGPEAEALVFGMPAMNRIVLQEIQGRTVRAFPQLGVLRVKIPADKSVQGAVQWLRDSGTVEYAEPNYYRYSQRLMEAGSASLQDETLLPKWPLLPTPAGPAPAPKAESSPVAQENPDDDDFPQQWGLQNTGQEINGTSGTADADIDAPEAWGVQINGASATDGAAAVVALIDSGVDYRHEDLQDNMWQDESGSYGFNALNNAGDSQDPLDDDGHGTHLAGIIGASGNNGLGVCGVNWKTRIMSLKFIDDSGVGTDADAVECITYALEHKGDSPMVINVSWGGEDYSTALHDAIAQARRAGVLVVAAAGNNGRNTDFAKFYPAGYADLDNIIAVGASDQKDARASFSNYGARSVDLFAPGVNILSTFPEDSYGLASGTSTACPFVTGAATLIWSKNPRAHYRTVRSLLLKNVDKKRTFRNTCVSGGRLNLYNAVSKLAGSPQKTKPSPIKDPSLNLRLR